MDGVAAARAGRNYEDDGDERSLILAAQGDPAAFGMLYTRYLDRIYSFLRVRTTSEEDAADLTQQVFTQALAALPRYKLGEAPFSAWLFRIAHNLASNYYRQRRTTLSWNLLLEKMHPADYRAPDEGVLLQEELTLLRGLTAGLASEKQELLALRFSAGLTSREISHVVNKSEASVQKQLTRILNDLRASYKERN